MAQGIWAAAFSSGMDAVRFTHAAQMLLMYVKWTHSETKWCGPAIPSPDGRFLFAGPRVSMAIHESRDYFVSAEQQTTCHTLTTAACCTVRPGSHHTD